MRLGTLIGKKINGEWECFAISSELQELKEAMKEEKINEKDSDYTEIRLATAYSKTYKIKTDKTEKKTKPKKDAD